MKRMFTERVPITVYVERSHRDALLADAKASGKLFSEYLRELLGDLSGQAEEAVSVISKETSHAPVRKQQEQIAEQVLTEGSAVGHHPRCSCLACKPLKKAAK